MCVSVLLSQSLDVNQAVNNLLSRDDDDGGEGHEEGIPSFLPSGGEEAPCELASFWSFQQ